MNFLGCFWEEWSPYPLSQLWTWFLLGAKFLRLVSGENIKIGCRFLRVVIVVSQLVAMGDVLKLAIIFIKKSNDPR